MLILQTEKIIKENSHFLTHWWYNFESVSSMRFFKFKENLTDFTQEMVLLLFQAASTIFKFINVI